MYGNVTSHLYGFLGPFRRPQCPAAAQGSEGAVTFKRPSGLRGLGEDERLASRESGGLAGQEG